MASPTFAPDGTPIVKAPDSVIFKSSETWKGYLVAQFHGTAPSPTKIFSDLNPIWGKQGRIRVRHHSKNVCLIFIPCEIIRKWVLDVAFWHSGKCAFSVSEWSPTMNLAPMKLEYAPVWVLFRKIPEELWSLEGFSTIATGVGFPVQSEFPLLKPYTNGVVKLKVIVKLAGKKAPSVKVVDKLQNSVTVSAEYLNLPHKCIICSEYGHSEQRCPDKNISKSPLAPSPGIEHSSLPPPRESLAQMEISPTSSKAGSSGQNRHGETPPLSAANPTSKELYVPTQTLRKSNSSPSLKVTSASATGSGQLEWIPVRNKSPPRRSPSPIVSVVSSKTLPSSHFDSEEELISAAQQLIRKRLEAENADFPPFSTAKEKKRFRKQQRKVMAHLRDGPSVSASTSNSNLIRSSTIPMVTTAEPSVKGLAAVTPDA